MSTSAHSAPMFSYLMKCQWTSSIGILSSDGRGTKRLSHQDYTPDPETGLSVVFTKTTCEVKRLRRKDFLTILREHPPTTRVGFG